jgi:serine/threonine protein kinase
MYMHSRIVNKQPVPLQTVESVLHGLLSALVCLEHHGILHRDIKDDNCLIFGQEPHVVAKLIDFGLAKKFDQDGLNIPVLDGAAPHDAGGEEGDDQSKLFRGETQYAPETLGREELGLRRQFVHKSDLWAVGTMILYPLLFWCRVPNVSLYGTMSLSNRSKAIRFPFLELWGGFVTPDNKAVPKCYSQDHLRRVLRKELGLIDGVDAFPYGDEPRFERLCHILEQM